MIFAKFITIWIIFEFVMSFAIESFFEIEMISVVSIFFVIVTFTNRNLAILYESKSTYDDVVVLVWNWFERMKVERDFLNVRIFRDLDTFKKFVLDNDCFVLFSFIASSLLFFCLAFQSCIKRFTIFSKIFIRSSHLLISCFCRCNRV